MSALVRITDPSLAYRRFRRACLRDASRQRRHHRRGELLDGPQNTDGCGGLTGVNPLTLYGEWILRIARAWGAGI